MTSPEIHRLTSHHEISKMVFKRLALREEALQSEIVEHGEIVLLDSGEFIIKQGQYIKWLSIVIDGQVRVGQDNEHRSSLLYFVEPYQTCVLSLSAIYTDCISTVNAMTTCKTSILKIPTRHLKSWLDSYPSWRAFVMKSYIESYQDLVDRHHIYVFNGIQGRLIEYFKNYVKFQGTIYYGSHADLANELGSTREVISRILPDLEQEGIIQRGYKKITILKDR